MPPTTSSTQPSGMWARAIAATGIKLIPQLRKHPLGFLACLAFVVIVFGAIALARIPLGWVLLVIGGIACTWTWRRIAP